jgi:hypothetical protein
MFARAIPVYVYLNRFADGSRRVVQIAELAEDMSVRAVDIGDGAMPGE